MSKLYCFYDHNYPKTSIADHQCDICGKLLCKICGYIENGLDYCNECETKKERGEDEKFDYHPKPKDEDLFKRSHKK